MNLTLEILVLGGPLFLSLAWFAFWVIRIVRTARKLKKRPPGSTVPGGAGSAGAQSAPGEQQEAGGHSAPSSS
jgi:hypothetical protein